MKKLILIVALAGMICFPGLASATTVEYWASPSVSTTLTDWNYAPALRFQQFNSATYGTLNSVRVQLYSSMDTDIYLTNNSPTEESSGNITGKIRLYAGSAGGSILSALKYTLSFPDSDGIDFNLGVAPGPGNTLLTGVMYANGSSNINYSTSAVKTEFTGLGYAYINAYTYSSVSLDASGGNLSLLQISHADLTGKVTYDYTPFPIPVPSTVLLLGTGLVGLGLLRRRKLRLKK